MRPKKYKTEKERIEAIRQSKIRWAKKHPRKDAMSKAARKKYSKEYYEKNKHLWRERYQPPKPKQDTSALMERIVALETEIKELKLDFDEVLKDNKKLADLIKWGEEMMKWQMNGLSVITDIAKRKRAVKELLEPIENGDVKADDFKYQSSTDDIGFHESYETANSANDRAILIIKDPKFYSITAFIECVPILVYIDKKGEAVPALFERIRKLKEEEK